MRRVSLEANFERLRSRPQDLGKRLPCGRENKVEEAELAFRQGGRLAAVEQRPRYQAQVPLAVALRQELLSDKQRPLLVLSTWPKRVPDVRHVHQVSLEDEFVQILRRFLVPHLGNHVVDHLLVPPHICRQDHVDNPRLDSLNGRIHQLVVQYRHPRFLHDLEGGGGVEILEDGSITVLQGQFVFRLDEELIVHPRMCDIVHSGGHNHRQQVDLREIVEHMRLGRQLRVKVVSRQGDVRGVLAVMVWVLPVCTLDGADELQNVIRGRLAQQVQAAAGENRHEGLREGLLALIVDPENIRLLPRLDVQVHSLEGGYDPEALLLAPAFDDPGLDLHLAHRLPQALEPLLAPCESVPEFGTLLFALPCVRLDEQRPLQGELQLPPDFLGTIRLGVVQAGVAQDSLILGHQGDSC
mmetsp:Transcript_125140/g.359362  ORF Transcript_125140/g.359362 Transcript_125140/m.359362 type:complete len:411 (+) Transcript_125140:367-1599(+)